LLTTAAASASATRVNNVKNRKMLSPYEAPGLCIMEPSRSGALSFYPSIAGGPSPIGCLGHAVWAREIVEHFRQMQIDFRGVIVPDGQLRHTGRSLPIRIKAPDRHLFQPRSPAQPLAALGTTVRWVHLGYSAGMSLTINSLDLVAKESSLLGFNILPSATERSAKDLDEVVALAAQRKYCALVDKTFPRRAGHQDHRLPRMSAKAADKDVLTF
jgi:hypothetical protein